MTPPPPPRCLQAVFFPVFSLTASSDMLLDLSDILQVSHSHLLPKKKSRCGTVAIETQTVPTAVTFAGLAEGLQ